ncbi:MAG: 2,3-bisphosphoglycerate-independent phosphoglycerate mutase [bacterium]
MVATLTRKPKKIKSGKLLPAVLIVIDGFGIAPPGPGNAITLAKTPNYDKFINKYPSSSLEASGEAVGLPKGQQGNSEAGHINMAAGRVVEQDVVTILRSIEDGRFFRNPAFLYGVRHSKKWKSKIHLMGLLSNGNSGHSNPDHIQALLKFCRQQKLKDIYIHLFTDGRDTHPKSGINMIKDLEKTLNKNEHIASITGRFWSMDRKKDWPRTERAYHTLTLGEGKTDVSAEQAIQNSYNQGITDEFIEPTLITKRGKPIATIDDYDTIIFFNLRSDRARQLTKPFVQESFNEFQRRRTLKNLLFIAMTDFGPDLDNVVTAHPSQDLKGTLPMALKELRQLYIAETEKFAHITYFFNGGYAEPVADEDRVMVASPEVPTYESKPAMSSFEIARTVIKYLQNNVYDFVGMNFANPDMVGHSGNLSATIKAIETVDKCLGQIVRLTLKQGGVTFITADHGKAESMLFKDTKKKDTEHTTNPVPFIVVADKDFPKKISARGTLGQIAPTVLETLNIPIPEQMKLKSLWE